MRVYLSDLVIVFSAIAITLVLSKWSTFYARKVLHILAISACAHAVSITTSDTFQFFVYLIGGFSVILTFAVWKGFFKTEGRRSWGIAYFPWVLFFLMLIFPSQLKLISLSFYILAISDGLSAIIGRWYNERWGSKFFPNEIQWGRDAKTLIGSLAFALSSWVLLMFFYPQSPVFCLFVWALTIASIELISSSGSDNLTVPLWVFFTQSILMEFTFDPIWMITGIALALLIYKFKWLTISGIVFSAILALVFLIADAPLYLLFIFLMLGSLASRLNHRKTLSTSESKSSKPRDAFQVIANGGISVLILLFFGGYPEFRDFLIYVSISVALADTLSSEFGVFFGGRTFSLIRFKEVPKGLSGGVSLAGTGAGLVGASLVGLLSYLHGNWNGDSAVFASVMITIIGFLGMLLDSIMGEFFQSKYRTDEGLLSDSGDVLVGGFSGFTNDTTNWVSNALTVFLAAIWVMLV